MKPGNIKLARTSVALLVIQLAIVSLVAAKYLYQRWTCPKVWTRTVAYDPDMLMRGRYLSLQLMVDGCQSTLPSAAEATMPRNVDGLPVGQRYSVSAQGSVDFPATLKVQGNKLVAIRIPDAEIQAGGQMVGGLPGSSCDDFRLDTPVDFYIAENAADPTRLKAGQQLWIEVTVPPKGPPRPIQLALKDGNAWKPLAFQ
jgi:uncharacterized membrane-anchored protein